MSAIHSVQCCTYYIRVCMRMFVIFVCLLVNIMKENSIIRRMPLFMKIKTVTFVVYAAKIKMLHVVHCAIHIAFNSIQFKTITFTK